MEAEVQSGRFPPGRTFGQVATDWNTPRLFEDLLCCAGSRTFRLERQIPGLCHQLLDEMFPSSTQALSGGDEVDIDTLIRRIRACPQAQWSFPDLAEELAISYSLLRKRFKQITGLPPHQFMLRERINLAFQMLFGGYSVKETAAKVGFTNPYHFSRLFKRHTGLAPSEHFKKRRRSPRSATR